MIALVDMDPRWVTIGTQRVGVSFACPGVPDRRVAVFVDPPFDDGPISSPAWRRTGDTFDTLTLTPSISTDYWHGHITDGQVTP